MITAISRFFVRDAGEGNSSARYHAQGPGYGFAFARNKALLSFVRGNRGAALALRFIDANATARPTGVQRLPGKINYKLGNDPAQWGTDLPIYSALRYGNLWPRIEMSFRGEKGQLKYQFVLGPHAQVQDIRLAYRGAQRLSVDARGNLRIRTPLGVLVLSRPLSYQEIRGRRVPVRSHFALSGGDTFGFSVGAYDRNRPLVIDPGLAYSTYLGGSGTDVGYGIAIDPSGDAYVTGYTTGPATFPTTPGTFDASFNGGIYDAFVTKLNPTETALLYSTYLGGNGDDRGYGIAVDGAGDAFVTGATSSLNFPVISGAFDASFNGGSYDFFVTKLTPSGTALLYSTYLGGSGTVGSFGDIALDGAGDAFVTGYTDSTNFPTTAGAFDTSFNGGTYDAVLTKINPAGAALVYSTYPRGRPSEHR